MKMGIALAVLALLGAGFAAYAWHVFNHRTPGGSFDSAGVRIHYTDEGAGEPVILVHGFAVNGDLNWRRPGVVAALSKAYRVIVPDLRGHGLSGKPHDPEAYGVEMSEDIVRLMDHLGIAKAHVVGYSLGGFIALKLATMHPDRLITVTAGGAGWEEPRNHPFMNRIRMLCAQLESGCGVNPPGGMMGEGRPKPGFGHIIFVKIVSRYFNDRPALAAMMKNIRALSFPETELRNIQLPVCSIAGSDDPLRPSLENMRGKIWDHTVTIVEGANHLQTPGRKEFIEALSAFLKDNPAAKENGNESDNAKHPQSGACVDLTSGGTDLGWLHDLAPSVPPEERPAHMLC